MIVLLSACTHAHFDTNHHLLLMMIVFFLQRRRMVVVFVRDEDLALVLVGGLQMRGARFFLVELFNVRVGDRTQDSLLELLQPCPLLRQKRSISFENANLY